MFEIQYFISYEIVKNPETVLRGFDVLKAPLFSDLADFVDDYCYAVATANKTEFEKVNVIQFNKVN